MRKSGFLKELAAEAGTTKIMAEKVIDALHPVLKRLVVENGEEVCLSIGKFKRKNIPARQGISPLTGKQVNTPSSRSLLLKPSRTLRIMDEK